MLSFLWEHINPLRLVEVEPCDSGKESQEAEQHSPWRQREKFPRALYQDARRGIHMIPVRSSLKELFTNCYLQ